MKRVYLVSCVLACVALAIGNSIGWSALATKGEWTPAGRGVGGGRGAHHIYFHK